MWLTAIRQRVPTPTCTAFDPQMHAPAVQVFVLVLGIAWAATDDAGAVISGIFWVFSVGWYTAEWIMCGTRRFLINRKQEMNVYRYVDQLRRTEPSVEFHVVCWHMETRTRTVTRTDGQGRSYTTTETYQEMVVTHSRAPSLPSHLHMVVEPVGAFPECGSIHAVGRHPGPAGDAATWCYLLCRCSTSCAAQVYPC